MQNMIVGWQSSLLIIVITFATMFSLLYASFQLYYRPVHPPDTIVAEPKISQAETIDVVEADYRKWVPDFQEAYLHFHYYNFSRELYEQDQQYQGYLQSLGAGWELSHVKAKPELLNLPLFFVHANGTHYLIDSKTQEFEKICEKPSIDCGSLSQKGGEASRDRLVYEVGAIVEGRDFRGDIHYIVDAETGRIVYHTSYLPSRPMLPRAVLDNQYSIKELNKLIEGTQHGTAVEIVQNASQIALDSKSEMKGFKPAWVSETLLNVTRVGWFNYDGVSHTVTSDDGYVDLLGNKFDSGIIEPGQHYEFVFIEFGYYPYHCDIHPWMRGTVEIMENFA